MKLKTLNEIEGGIDEYYEIFAKNLKQEAIKHILNQPANRNWFKVFKEFFNIIGDDLKVVKDLK